MPDPSQRHSRHISFIYGIGAVAAAVMEAVYLKSFGMTVVCLFPLIFVILFGAACYAFWRISNED